MTVCISEKQINKIIISLPTIRYDLEIKTNIIRYRKIKFILSRPRNSEIMIFFCNLSTIGRVIHFQEVSQWKDWDP